MPTKLRWLLSTAVLLNLSACAPPPSREEINSAAQECSAHVEGGQAFIDCSDGSHFQSPASGGIAYGFDQRGHDLEAYVSVTDENILSTAHRRDEGMLDDRAPSCVGAKSPTVRSEAMSTFKFRDRSGKGYSYLLMPSPGQPGLSPQATASAAVSAKQR